MASGKILSSCRASGRPFLAQRGSLISLSANSAHRFENLRSIHLPGVEIVRGYHSGPVTAWEFFPMVRISRLLSGRARIWSHGQGAVIDAGQIVVNAPGCIPRIVERLTETTETLTAHVDTLLFDSIAVPRGLPRAKQLEVHLVSSEALSGALRQLAAGSEGGARARGLRGGLGAARRGYRRAVPAPQSARPPGGPLPRL